MINPMNMSGQSILITGASSGIGKATAILTSALGARVVLVGRDEARLAATLSLLEGEGHQAISSNLEEADSVDVIYQSLERERVVLSGLFHAAGTETVTTLSLLTASEVQRALTVPVQAALLLTKGFARKKIRSAGMTSIVLMSSAAGSRGQAGIAAYSASKAAVDGLVRSLAIELSPKLIRVNGIAPGAVETPMHDRILKKMTATAVERYRERHPLGFGSARAVAQAACFLLSSASEWITGTCLRVDGGYCAA